MAPSRTLRWVLATLTRLHGAPPRPVSTDPLRLILYQQVAYLVPERQRRAAFKRLREEVGLTSKAILGASASVLRSITRAGGPIAAPRRAERLRQSAEIVERRWGGNLRRALGLPLPEARRALAAFPMIGPPGADRILAATGAYPVLGLDSNGVRVCLRLGWGKERPGYAATYRTVLEGLAPELPAEPRDLAAASALLRRHGETVCRRSTPDCAGCPLAGRCPYPVRRRGG